MVVSSGAWLRAVALRCAPKGGRVGWNGWSVVWTATRCTALVACPFTSGNQYNVPIRVIPLPTIGHMALQGLIGMTLRSALFLLLRWLIQVATIGGKKFDEPEVSGVFIDKVSTNSQPLEA